MGRGAICVALYLSVRHARLRLCPKGADSGVKPSAPSCPLTLPLYLGFPTKQAENQGTLPGGVASVEFQTVPIAVETTYIHMPLWD